MAAVSLTPADLAPFASIEEPKAQAMIDDVLALAATVAPCINDADFASPGAAKAILRGAVLRWHEAGQGSLRTAAVDDVSLGFETGQKRSGMFWPSEITQLQKMCQESGSGGAFSVDTVGVGIEQHSDICALRFGAQYCSCGAVLTMNLPLYENL